VKDNRIVLLRTWAGEGERVKGAYQIAKDLAEKAASAKGAARVS
jgi:transcription-repair coupling factor (superfamily II helicase)